MNNFSGHCVPRASCSVSFPAQRNHCVKGIVSVAAAFRCYTWDFLTLVQDWHLLVLCFCLVSVHTELQQSTTLSTCKMHDTRRCITLRDIATQNCQSDCPRCIAVTPHTGHVSTGLNPCVDTPVYRGKWRTSAPLPYYLVYFCTKLFTSPPGHGRPER